MDDRKIKAIMIDVDGTLTDGLYHVDEKGVITKSFFTRDFWAIRRAREEGFDVYLVTGAIDGCAITKANFANIEIIAGSEDKVIDVQNIIVERSNFLWKNIAFIGDGENDIEIMNICGYTGAPSDAVEEILNGDLSFLSDKKGGEGAVYEFIRYIFRLENIEWIAKK